MISAIMIVAIPLTVIISFRLREGALGGYLSCLKGDIFG